MQRCEGVLTSDARQDDRFDTAASIVHSGVREAICVPMQGRYDVVGLIYIDTSTPPGRALDRITGNFSANKFTEEHLKLMVAIGHQAALAVEDTNYYSAMVQAERLAAVGQTIASLSHHIKNILQGIRGGSYLIEMGLADHDEEVVGKGWDIVERNQRKISALVMDMLTFSKEREPEFAAGRSQRGRRRSDRVDAIAGRRIESATSLGAGCDDPAAHVRFRGDPSGRAEHRHQRARRLRFTRSRRWSRCAPSNCPTRARCKSVVEDNGTGIDAESLKQIFNPFFSSKGARGTGLGPGREPKDFEGARRPDPRRKPAGRRKPLHAGISRHAGRRRAEAHPPSDTIAGAAPTPAEQPSEQ